MTRTLICALGLGALVGSVPLQAAEDPGIALPAVPRALLLADHEYRDPLKSAGLLSRDARVKERKKYGRKGARARFQFSKR